MFICIAVLAFLVSQAAEVPPTGSASSTLEATKTSATKPDSAPSVPGIEEAKDADDEEDDDYLSDESEDDYFFDDDDDDDQDEYEDDEEDSAEDDLSELAEEHHEVKEDCENLSNIIEEARQSGNATVDPELLDYYEGCKEALGEIERDMKELTEEILADGEDQQ